MGIKINQIELLAQGVLTDSTTTCIIYTYFTGCLIDISSIIYSIHSMQMQDKALEFNRLIEFENINYTGSLAPGDFSGAVFTHMR